MHSCDRSLNAIHELVDGTLGPLRRAELDQHLDSCEACRTLVADLLEIARTAQALAPLAPPDRVWPQLAGRLRAEGRVAVAAPGALWQRHVPMLALAAALVLAVGASLFVLRQRGGSVSTPTTASPESAPGNAALEDPVQSVATELTLTERHFENAVARATDPGTGVDPATAVVLRKNLLVMNEAIAESRKAIEADPQSTSAQQSLYGVLKQKIQFLQDTIALMNEMRQGDAAGAAQIVEGGKS